LLQLFLDATDTTASVTVLEEKYKCSRQTLEAVLELLKAIFPGAAVSNEVNFDLNRPGSVGESEDEDCESDEEITGGGAGLNQFRAEGNRDKDEDDDDDDDEDVDDAAERSGSGSGSESDEDISAESSVSGSGGESDEDVANTEGAGEDDHNSEVSETGGEEGNQCDGSAQETASNNAISGDADANQNKRMLADDPPQVCTVPASLVTIEPESAGSKPATVEAESQNAAFPATQVTELPPAKKPRPAKGIPETGARVVRLNFILTQRTVQGFVT
jgi:hypothetical protein